jgi:hypothetical protein
MTTVEKTPDKSKAEGGPPPTATSPSVRAAATEKAAYAVAEEQAKERTKAEAEALQQRRQKKEFKVGDMVKYLGLALEVKKVHEDNPNVIDVDTYERVSIWEVEHLVPEPGWEEHAAKAGGDPGGGAKKAAEPATKAPSRG